MDVLCQGCHSVLGMVYASTPKNMDHNRFMFYFNVADIDRYVWVITVSNFVYMNYRANYQKTSLKINAMFVLQKQ